MFWTICLCFLFLYCYYEWHWWKAECKRIEYHRTRPVRFAEYGEEDILTTLLMVEDEEMLRNIFKDRQIPTESKAIVPALQQAVQASLGPVKKISMDLQQVAKIMYYKLYGKQGPPPKTTTTATTSSTFSILHSNSKIYMWWTPAFVDSLLSWYRQSYERDLIDAGCTRIVIDGVPIYVKVGTDTEPPVILLHGISTTMGGAVELMRENPTRTFYLPQNITLSWGKKIEEFMTTLSFTKTVCKFVKLRNHSTVSIVAWSYGGFVRNYLSILLTAENISIDREVLVEPMGLPLSNAIASTCCLMPFHETFKRAMYYCPKSNPWMQAGIIAYLRLYRNIRPLITDAFWNRYSLGESWNHAGMTILLVRDDFLVPFDHTLEYKRTKLPLASLEYADGVHGSWPYKEEYVKIVTKHITRKVT